MYKTKVISNAKLNQIDLYDICQIKSKSWEYSLESQKEWILRNNSPEDQHLLVYEKNNVVAYANLLNVSIIMHAANVEVIGVGSVCSGIKGMGYGTTLMNIISEHLEKEKKSGLLFCKKSLIKFYQKFGWHSVSVITDMFSLSTETCAMCFNITPLEICYKGREF